MPGTSMLMAWRTLGNTSAVAASLLQTWRGTSLTARQASSKLGGSPWLILLFSKKHERAKVRERQRERERERLLCEPTSNCSCIGFGLRCSEQEGLLSVSNPVPGQRPMMKSSGSTCEAARSHLCLAPYLSMCQAEAFQQTFTNFSRGYLNSTPWRGWLELPRVDLAGIGISLFYPTRPTCHTLLLCLWTERRRARLTAPRTPRASFHNRWRFG